MRSFLGRDILSLKDFERADFERVFEVCDELAPIAKSRRNADLLTGKTLLTAFYQPSTRTRLATEAAMHRLGGHVLGFSDAKMTRAGDFYQESIKDTVHMLEYYGDVIAMRHFEQGAPAEAARWASVPVINCGDGWGEHPTQVLTDLYTTSEGARPARRARRTCSSATCACGRCTRSCTRSRSSTRRRTSSARPRCRSCPSSCSSSTSGTSATRRPTSVEDVIAECDVIYMEPVVQADYTASREERGEGGVATTPGDVPRHARAAARARRSRARSSCTACRGWTSCPRTSTRRATRATGRRRSTASSCGWRCSRSCWGRWSSAWSSRSTASTVVAEPREGQSLLELLRDDLGLRSVKDGCAPEGSCGACTVIVDGQAVVSCAQKATRVEGKSVVTQEGLSEDERAALGRVLRRRRRLAVRLLLAGDRDEGRGAARRRTPSPTREEIAHALARQPLPLHRLREDRRRGRARRRAPGAASRCPRSTAAGGVGRAHAALPGRRARARRQAVRRRPRRARDAARRAALLRPPAGARAAHRHVAGARRTRASSRS